jgi:GNAT superfamily N-acetyltransferase
LNITKRVKYVKSKENVVVCPFSRVSSFSEQIIVPYKQELVMKEVSFRSADAADTPLIARFLRELAAYERMEASADIDEGRLARHLAPDASPQIYVIIAECGGMAVGMATYFLRYSTFRTAWGLHLEDLYVIEEYRERGMGRAFFVVMARLAERHGYARIDLSVLNWNPAQNLYRRLGAEILEQWIPMRLEGDALHQLVRQPELHGVVIGRLQ